MFNNSAQDDKKAINVRMAASVSVTIFLLAIIGIWILIMSFFSSKQAGFAFENSQELDDYLESGVWEKTAIREYPIQAIMSEEIDITSQDDIEIIFQEGEVERKVEKAQALQQENEELYYKDDYQIDEKRMAAVSYLNTFGRIEVAISDGQAPQCMALELNYYYGIDEDGFLIERLALYDNLIDEYYFVSEANIYKKSN